MEKAAMVNASNVEASSTPTEARFEHSEGSQAEAPVEEFLNPGSCR
jgi:hypothetical protein